MSVFTSAALKAAIFTQQLVAVILTAGSFQKMLGETGSREKGITTHAMCT